MLQILQVPLLMKLGLFLHIPGACFRVIHIFELSEGNIDNDFIQMETISVSVFESGFQGSQLTFN